MNEVNPKEIETRLKAPFYPNEIEWRLSTTIKEKMKGLAVAYVNNRAIQNRLDEVMGFENWKNEFIITDKSKICGLSLRIGGEWVTKFDGADDTNIESTKGGLSNSMKRAAVQWGIGRYLYNLTGQWVKIKQQGKTYVIDGDVPKLPEWALPDDYKKSRVTKKWESPKKEKQTTPEPISECIKSFAKIGVTKADLENYLHLEADMFTDTDIETLRTVYAQIKNGKSKDDFFGDFSTQRSEKTLRLEESLK